ncbi:MAG: U32 family peptidase, partial [Candidatus Saccharimonadales bacterium]
GQCLTSEALGGRSANRGQCAQACRLPYELIVDGRRRDLGDRAYLLSPQDLAAHEQIGDLVRLGVASLKIEGRMKSAHYVAAVTQAYRAVLDAAMIGRPHALDRQERLDLQQSFSRGFTPGFLDGVNHQRLVAGRFPKSRGVCVGAVVGGNAQEVVIEFAEQLHPDASESILKPGDGVVFDEGHPEQEEQGGRIAGVKRISGRPRVAVTFAPGAVQLAAVRQGSIVWRTDDPDFRRRMQRSFARDCTPRRVPVKAQVAGRIGGALHLTFSYDAGNSATAVWAGPLQAAHKHPLTIEVLRTQLGRLGDTPLALAEVDLDLPEAVMAPKSVLNDLRRQAVASLLAQRSADAAGRLVHAEALAE